MVSKSGDTHKGKLFAVILLISGNTIKVLVLGRMYQFIPVNAEKLQKQPLVNFEPRQPLKLPILTIFVILSNNYVFALFHFHYLTD